MIYYTECQNCDTKWTYTPDEYERFKFKESHHKCKTCNEQFYRWIKREGLYKTSSGRIVDIDPKHYNVEPLPIEKPKPKPKAKPKKLLQPQCHICKKKFPRSIWSFDRRKKGIMQQHQEEEHGLQFGKICRDESRRQFRNRHESHYSVNIKNDRLLQDQVERYLYADEMIAGSWMRVTNTPGGQWR